MILFLLLLSAMAFGAPQWTVWDSSNTPMRNACIRQVVTTDSGPAWVGTYGEGLFRVDAGRWIREERFPADGYILRLLVTDGTLWAGTARSGALRWDGRAWTRYSEQQGLCDPNVWDLLPLPGGEMLLGSRYRGLSILKEGKISCLSPEGGLPDREITCLDRDASGRIWIGTARGGLCGLGSRDTVYLNMKSGLSGNYIRALLCNGAPQWVATWDGGLDRFADGRWVRETRVRPPVVALARAPDGAVWAGTWGHGAWRFRRGKWKGMEIPGEGAARNQVIDIDFDSSGSAYLSTSAGLFRFRE